MKKYLSLVVAMLFISTTLFAQYKHEVSVFGAGGLSTLKNKINEGKQKNNTGGSFGFNYNYYLTQNWSIGTGLEFAFYSAELTIDKLNDSYEAKDGEESMIFKTEITNYKEKQNVSLLNIPIKLQFEKTAFSNHLLYASTGFKIGFPTSKKNTIKNATYNNSGYYPQWDAELNEQEFVGFGKFDRSNQKNKLDIKTSIQVSVEAGMKWKLMPTMHLYTGAYLDYGLNDINKKQTRRMVEYNELNPIDFTTNGALSSVYGDNTSTKKVVDKLHPISVGIKLKLAFSLN